MPLCSRDIVCSPTQPSITYHVYGIRQTQNPAWHRKWHLQVWNVNNMVCLRNPSPDINMSLETTLPTLECQYHDMGVAFPEPGCQHVIWIWYIQGCQYHGVFTASPTPECQHVIRKWHFQCWSANTIWRNGIHIWSLVWTHLIGQATNTHHQTIYFTENQGCHQIPPKRLECYWYLGPCRSKQRQCAETL